MPDDDSQAADEIVVILQTAMGGEEFDLAAPSGSTINAILVSVLENPEFPFRLQDDAGRRIQYTLIWEEGGQRALHGSETLAGAGVRSGNHLTLRQEARAGERGHRSDP
jgi:hypothetical protein